MGDEFGRGEEDDQEALLREAFGGGTTHEDDYEEEEAKKKKEQEEQPMFGWGSWAGEGLKTLVTQPDGASRKKKKAAESEDADLAKIKKPKVVVSEKLDRKSAKYFVSDLPYGAQTKDQYEAQLRHPTGPEWNSMPVHQKMIQPKVWARLGKVVAPLQFAKNLDPKARDAVLDAWDGKKKPKATRVKF